MHPLDAMECPRVHSQPSRYPKSQGHFECSLFLTTSVLHLRLVCVSPVSASLPASSSNDVLSSSPSSFVYTLVPDSWEPYVGGTWSG